MTDLAYLLTGSPDEKITWQGHTTTSGGAVYGSRRSIAHLEATDEAARKRYGTGLQVMQSAYHTGYAPSAGTHDFDAVYDVAIPGVPWRDQEHFFREQGWAAWYRYPPTFPNHIHAVSLGYTTRVGVYVPGQVADYYAHRSGLAGHVADSSWHPADIDSTIFNYSAWAQAQEEIVTPEDIDKIAAAVVKRLLDTDLYPRLGKVEQTVADALKGKPKGEQQ